jgi:cyclopropane fatty-acyl-phospholipid synthase-like methyltransferase
VDKESISFDVTDPTQVNTFEGFKNLASRSDISKFEKIGFPDSYRDGHEFAICEDIVEKLRLRVKKGQEFLDIGSGCSDLPSHLLRIAQENNHSLTLLDSEEMHQNLSMAVRSGTKQVNAEFPYCPDFIYEHENKFDSILCYSVIQYPFLESSVIKFLDSMLVLLKPSGRLLIGDIPNLSMKKRFLNSSAGKAFHEQYFGQNSQVDTDFNTISFNKMDDSVVIGLILRARAAGFHAYLVPQSDDLPLSNRREDILIVNP